eukprot:9124974-Pyramimonas_sp.AAC.2
MHGEPRQTHGEPRQAPALSGVEEANAALEAMAETRAAHKKKKEAEKGGSRGLADMNAALDA